MYAWIWRHLLGGVAGEALCTDDLAAAAQVRAGKTPSAAVEVAPPGRQPTRSWRVGTFGPMPRKVVLAVRYRADVAGVEMPWLSIPAALTSNGCWPRTLAARWSC